MGERGSPGWNVICLFTSLGRVVSDLLVTGFPDVLAVGFTAKLEDELDDVEEGRDGWIPTLHRFWKPFEKRLGEAKAKMPEVKRTGVKTGIKCELDGGEMVIKWGRNGEFLACSNYPKCRNTKEFKRDEQGGIQVVESAAAAMTDVTCEKCGKPMVRKRSRFGEFLGCSGYPDCDGIKRLKAEPVKTGVHCPECKEGEMLERRTRRGKIFWGCGRYPKCKFASWDKVIPQPCPSCAAPYLVEKVTKKEGARWQCAKEGCDYRIPVPDSAIPPSTPPSSGGAQGSEDRPGA